MKHTTFVYTTIVFILAECLGYAYAPPGQILFESKSIIIACEPIIAESVQNSSIEELKSTPDLIKSLRSEASQSEARREKILKRSIIDSIRPLPYIESSFPSDESNSGPQEAKEQEKIEIHIWSKTTLKEILYTDGGVPGLVLNKSSGSVEQSTSTPEGNLYPLVIPVDSSHNSSDRNRTITSFFRNWQAAVGGELEDRAILRAFKKAMESANHQLEGRANIPQPLIVAYSAVIARSAVGQAFGEAVQDRSLSLHFAYSETPQDEISFVQYLVTLQIETNRQFLRGLISRSRDFKNTMTLADVDEYTREITGSEGKFRQYLKQQ
jgi:hypothetical protein